MALNEFKNRPGVWFVYNPTESSIEVVSIQEDPIHAIVDLANQGTARLGFWPTGDSLYNAVNWWETDGKAVDI